MRRKSFQSMKCPIALALEQVGEWWTMLIMRDALHGASRFDEFQVSLGIAPNILARRLTGLVEAGLLEKKRYQERPARDAYVPTERGRDLWPVLVTLLDWGNRHCAPEGGGVVLKHRDTGRPAEPVLVDRTTGLLMNDPVFIHVAAHGPAIADTLGTTRAERNNLPGAASPNDDHR